MGGSGAASVTGPRPHNEDSYVARDLAESSLRLGDFSAFLLVCDGMGGYSHGDAASAAAVAAAIGYFDSLLTSAPSATHAPEAPTIIIEAARRANAAVKGVAEDQGAATVGATYVAAIASPGRAWVGNIGDSRCYVLTRDGARQITADHSEVGRLMASGVLTEEQARTHDGRNVIDRALGFPSAGDPDVTAIELADDDVILLCSDGLSTALTGETMRAIVATAPSLSVAAGMLVDGALEAGTDDNTTVVLWSPSATPSWVTGLAPAGGNADRSAATTIITGPARDRSGETSDPDARKTSILPRSKGMLALVAALLLVAVVAAGVAGWAAFRVFSAKPPKVTKTRVVVPPTTSTPQPSSQPSAPGPSMQSTSTPRPPSDTPSIPGPSMISTPGSTR